MDCISITHKTARWYLLSHSTAQHSTAQHSTAQHSTAQQNSRAQHNTTQHQHNTPQHTITQHSTTQHQHNTTQRNTTQHNTTQHNATQLNATQTGGGGGSPMAVVVCGLLESFLPLPISPARKGSRHRWGSPPRSKAGRVRKNGRAYVTVLKICNPKAITHHPQGTVSKAALETTPLLKPHSFSLQSVS